MKRLFFILLLAWATPVACAQADRDQAAASKLLTLEKAKLQASQVKDLNALSEIFDEQFVCVDEQGTMQTKSLMMISVQTRDPVAYVTNEMVVRVHGDTAIATGLYQWKYTTNGRLATKRVRFIDTWVRRQGVWTILATLLTPVS